MAFAKVSENDHIGSDWRVNIADVPSILVMVGLGCVKPEVQRRWSRDQIQKWPPGFPSLELMGDLRGPTARLCLFCGNLRYRLEVEEEFSRSPTWAGVPPYGTHLDFVRDPERTGLFQYKYLDLPRPRNLCNAAARHSGADEAHKMD